MEDHGIREEMSAYQEAMNQLDYVIDLLNDMIAEHSTYPDPDHDNAIALAVDHLESAYTEAEWRYVDLESSLKKNG